MGLFSTLRHGRHSETLAAMSAGGFHLAARLALMRKATDLPTLDFAKVVKPKRICLPKIVSLVVALAVCSTSLFGQDFIWTQTSAPNKQWQFVTASADATILMAAVYGLTNEIWISTNSGLAWTKSAAPDVVQWSCGASSSDGSKLVAAVGDGVFGGTQ
jgi:hypothetical protein